MAKKFGKIMLVTAAIGAAAVAAYHYLQKKDAADTAPEDEDYDDFSENLDEASDSSHGYVSLTPEAGTENETEKKDTEKKDGFTPLTETVAQTAEKAEETVEEFFDEDDSAATDPPICDN